MSTMEPRDGGGAASELPDLAEASATLSARRVIRGADAGRGSLGATRTGSPWRQRIQVLNASMRYYDFDPPHPDDSAQ